MRAGSERHAGVHDDLDAVGVMLFPPGDDGKALADVHGVVIFLPGVLPVLLLNAGRVELIVDAAVFQPFLKQRQYLGGVLIGGKVHVYDDHIAGLIEQLLLDKVNMRDLPRLLFQIAVILDINAAVGDHRSDGLGRVGVALGNGDADVSPFHVGGSLFL